MESLFKINKITGEFITSEVEDQFILFLWPHIKKQIQITFYVGGGSYLAWAIYNLIIMNNNFSILIISMAKIIATIFFTIPLLFTRKSIKRFTNRLRFWIAISAVITSISEVIEHCISINSEGISIGIPFIIFFILFYYVLVPNRFLITIFTMLFISFIYIISIFYLTGPDPENILTIFYFITVNFVGYGILLTKNKLTRNDYALRLQLENEIQQRKKAQETAEISSKAKSQFLAVMNHEMRTPLNIILGGTQILSSKKIKQEHKEIISLIENSGSYLEGLIQNIMDFTGLEKNKLKIVEEQFSLKQHLENICTIYNKITNNKNIPFNYDITNIPEFIISDPIRLKQILINLLNNACKFCDTGSVFFNVCKKNENTIRFEIIDTGIGINKLNIIQILKPFYQVEQSSTRRYGGSGLGLTVCNELLNAMGCKLQIYSKENEGSCFSFDLPLKVVSNNNQKSIQPELRRYNILLVDDIDANLKIIGGLLKVLRQNVTYANSSESAILKSREDKFDILFIDFHMPGKNGIDTALEIKDLNKQIKIFLMTADTSTEVIQLCLKVGFNDFISKPISINQLKKSIQNIENEIENPGPKLSETEVSRDILYQDLIIDKIFISQLKSDLNNYNFFEVIGSCIYSLSEIKKLLEDTNDIDKISELHHRLKGLSGNYRLIQLYNYIKIYTSKDLLIKKRELLALIKKSIDALKSIK